MNIDVMSEGSEPQPPAADGEQPTRSSGRSKKKVRGAWISFVGRIVAQVIGASASVALGIVVLQRYQATAPAADPAASSSPAVTRASAPRADGSVALAVLPLDSFSADGADDYFADGMTEALIADLAQVEGLRVISRTSSMRYKDARKSLPEIARELDVDMIVEGSVTRASDRVRVTAQLIDARSDEHVWARSFDQTLRDVLTLQDEVASAIVREIRGALVSRPGAGTGARPPVDPSVYDLYLRGRHAWNLRTREGLELAVQRFEEAARSDAGFALAHAGLADAFTLLGLPPNNVPGTMPRARAAAERALELDEALAEAHTSLAVVRHRYDLDWEGAEREFLRALELNPGYITAHQWYALFLADLGRDAEALRHSEQAVRLDPLSWVMHQTLGMVHYKGRRYDPAAEEQRRALEMMPSAALSRIYLARALLASGRPQEAIDVCAAATPPRPADLEVLLALAQVRLGQTARAGDIVDRLRARSPLPTAALARWYSVTGDAPAALNALERAIDERADVVSSLRVEPQFDPLRSHPRFAALLRRARLGS